MNLVNICKKFIELIYNLFTGQVFFKFLISQNAFFKYQIYVSCFFLFCYPNMTMEIYYNMFIGQFIFNFISRKDYFLYLLNIVLPFIFSSFQAFRVQFSFHISLKIRSKAECFNYIFCYHRNMTQNYALTLQSILH